MTMGLDLHFSEHDVEVFHGHTTHNVVPMAKEAGAYHLLWRPDEVPITTAGQLTDPLLVARAVMQHDPARFAARNAPNGAGTVSDWTAFLHCVAEASTTWPAATVRATR